MAESLKDKVAIIGMGCTQFGELWDKDVDDLITEAAYEAFDDAGVKPKDIEAVWVGTMFSGITGASVACPLQLQYIPVTRVENACATGIESVRNAVHALIAKAYDLVLAIGVEKCKDWGFGGLHPVKAQSDKWHYLYGWRYWSGALCLGSHQIFLPLRANSRGRQANLSQDIGEKPL